MIKAVIFDADGTLYSLNPAPAYSRLYRFLSRETGSSERELGRRHALGIIAGVKGSKNPKVRTHLYSILKLVGDDRKKLAKMAEREFWKGLKIVKRPGTAVALRKLKSERYRLALASDEFLPHLSDKMEIALGKRWKKYFGCVVTPEAAGTMKPSGKYYRIILKKLKVRPSDAIVVGNSWEKDLEPAARMGMKTVLVGEKKRGRPDFVIRKVSSLLGILERWER